MAAPTPIVAENVSHSYGVGSMRRQVLQDINFRVEPGEVVLLTGPSGCGKTTIIETFTQLLQSKAVSYTHLTLPTKRIV